MNLSELLFQKLSENEMKMDDADGSQTYFGNVIKAVKYKSGKVKIFDLHGYGAYRQLSDSEVEQYLKKYFAI